MRVLTIEGTDPRQYSFSAALWTRQIVRDLIRQQFRVAVSLVTVGRILKKLGMSPQRPLYRAYQQDPDKVEAWKRETYPAIRAEATEVGGSIFFADEAGLRTDHHAGRTWAPVGRTPVVTATGQRVGINMISAITPSGQVRFQLVEGNFTAAKFIEFCKRLLNATAPVFLIVDGHPTHRAKAVKDYVASTDGRLRLFFLPGYSPELNPDEWVWKNGSSAVFVGPVRGRCAGCGAAPPRSRAPAASLPRGAAPPLDLRASAAPRAERAGRPGACPTGVRSAPEPRSGGWPPVKSME